MTPEEYVQQTTDSFFEENLFPLLRIQSISPDPSKKEEVQQAGQLVQQQLEQAGLEVRILESPMGGNNLVIGKTQHDPSKPTILLYGHFDVQPVDESEWDFRNTTSKPFDPKVIEHYVVARGATDDKGPLAATIHALKYFKGDFPCNITVVAEGEEESTGSQTLAAILKQNTELFATDAVFVYDTDVKIEGTPCITTCLKGIAIADYTSKDINTLLTTLASMHDPSTNKVQVQGFFDGVKAYKTLHPDVARLLSLDPQKFPFIQAESGRTAVEHMCQRPTFDPLLIAYASEETPGPHKTVLRIQVNGPREAVHSGEYGGPVVNPGLALAHIIKDQKDIAQFSYGGPDVSTKIYPQATADIVIDDDQVEGIQARIRSRAREMYGFDNMVQTQVVQPKQQSAKAPRVVISSRLVAGQDPEEVYRMLHRHITTHDPHAEIQDGGSAQSYLLDQTNPHLATVEAGLRRGYNSTTVHHAQTGGSIPIVTTFSTLLKAPVFLIGAGSPGGNLHGPNENISVRALQDTIRGTIYTIQEFGK